MTVFTFLFDRRIFRSLHNGTLVIYNSHHDLILVYWCFWCEDLRVYKLLYKVIIYFESLLYKVIVYFTMVHSLFQIIIQGQYVKLLSQHSDPPSKKTRSISFSKSSFTCKESVSAAYYTSQLCRRENKGKYGIIK